MGNTFTSQISQQNTVNQVSGDNSGIYSSDTKTNQQITLVFEVCHLALLSVIALALVVQSLSTSCPQRRRRTEQSWRNVSHV